MLGGRDPLFAIGPAEAFFPENPPVLGQGDGDGRDAGRVHHPAYRGTDRVEAVGTPGGILGNSGTYAKAQQQQ